MKLIPFLALFIVIGSALLLNDKLDDLSDALTELEAANQALENELSDTILMKDAAILAILWVENQHYADASDSEAITKLELCVAQNTMDGKTPWVYRAETNATCDTTWEFTVVMERIWGFDRWSIRMITPPEVKWNDPYIATGLK